MRRLMTCGPVVVAAFLLASCGDDAPQPIEVMLDFELHTPDDAPPYVTGNTNLPAGTVLMASVDEERPGGVSHTVKCEVAEGGGFRSPPLMEQGRLLPGEYSASVVMSVVPIQPEEREIHRVAGAKGELLSGPLVQQTAYGSTVRRERAITLGGDAARATQRERAVEEVAALEALFDDIVLEQREMETVVRNLESTRAPAGDPVWQRYDAELEPRLTDIGDRLTALRDGAESVGLRSLFVNLLKLHGDIMQSDGMSFDTNSRAFAVARQRTRDSLAEIRSFAGMPPRSTGPVARSRPPRPPQPASPPPPPLPIEVGEASSAEAPAAPENALQDDDA